LYDVGIACVCTAFERGDTAAAEAEAENENIITSTAGSIRDRVNIFTEAGTQRFRSDEEGFSRKTRGVSMKLKDKMAALEGKQENSQPQELDRRTLSLSSGLANRMKALEAEVSKGSLTSHGVTVTSSVKDKMAALQNTSSDAPLREEITVASSLKDKIRSLQEDAERPMERSRDIAVGSSLRETIGNLQREATKQTVTSSAVTVRTSLRLSCRCDGQCLRANKRYTAPVTDPLLPRTAAGWQQHQRHCYQGRGRRIAPAGRI